MNGKHVLTPPEKIMIREGVFHSTLAKTPLEMIEVETPNDKSDLLRLEDSYGRSGQPYEGEAFYSCEKVERIENESFIGKCVLSKIKSYGKEDLLGKISSGCKYVVANGFIFYKHIKVISPGDVVDDVTFNRLCEKFDVTEMTIFEVKKLA